MVQLFDEQTREDLQRTVVNLGFGVAGRGTELNAALANIVPLSRNLRRQLNAATREPGALGRLIAGAAATSSGLRGVRSDDVAGLIGSADETVSTIAGPLRGPALDAPAAAAVRGSVPDHRADRRAGARRPRRDRGRARADGRDA